MALIFSSLIADMIFGLAVLCAVLYFYFKHGFQYWKKRGVLYIEPTFPVGNLGNVFSVKGGPGGAMKRAYDEGVGHKVVGIYVFHKPALVIRDVDVVRSVLAKDAHAFLDRYFLPPEKFDRLFAKSLFGLKGKKWRHMRIKITPTFTSGKMKMMFQLINGTSKQLLNCIEQQVSTGKSVDVKHTMSRYTMDTIASCAFGVNANALENPDCEFITKMKKFFEPDIIQILVGTLVVFMPWMQKFVSEKYFDVGVNDFVRKTFWEVVNYRKEEGIVRKDFVDLLMQLREEGEVRAEDAKDLEEIQQDNKYMNTELSKNDYSDITLENDDIVAQAFIFIAAGYETSSSVLNFALFELATNPDIQNQLLREIEDVLEKHNSQVTYEAIAEMAYLDMVVSESLRKYPPVPFLDRECLSDFKIEGTDITIEKGSVIFIPALNIHYDPDIYPDPDKFDPERFSSENKSKRSNFVYLPFGEGPRKCMGMRFGLLQMKTALVQILKTFQVTPCKDTPRPPLKIKTITGVLAPEKAIVLAFTKHK